MPAQLATRPVFWAPAPPRVGLQPPGRAPGRAHQATRPPGHQARTRRRGPRHQVGGHQGAHQVTRATVPGTRSAATRSAATRSAATRSAATRSAAAAGRALFVYQVNKHQAPGHTNTNTGPGTRHQLRAQVGRRAQAPGRRATGHGHQGADRGLVGAIRGPRFTRPVAGTTGQAWAAARSTGYLGKPDGLYAPSVRYQAQKNPARGRV
jgi:hypothetical protein